MGSNPMQLSVQSQGLMVRSLVTRRTPYCSRSSRPSPPGPRHAPASDPLVVQPVKLPLRGLLRRMNGLRQGLELCWKLGDA
jgi:hypothetical protein